MPRGIGSAPHQVWLENWRLQHASQTICPSHVAGHWSVTFVYRTDFCCVKEIQWLLKIDSELKADF